MRVDAYNKVNQVYNTSKVNSVKKIGGSSFSDKLEISRTGNDYTFAKQIIDQIPDIRTEKINDIKSRMESGTYNVSMEEVAEKIINKYFDELI